MLLYIIVIILIIAGILGYFYFYKKSNNTTDDTTNNTTSDTAKLDAFLTNNLSSSNKETFTNDNWESILKLWKSLLEVLPTDFTKKLKCDELTRSNLRELVSCSMSELDPTILYNDDSIFAIYFLSTIAIIEMINVPTIEVTDIIQYNPTTKRLKFKLEEFRKREAPYKPFIVKINDKNVYFFKHPLNVKSSIIQKNTLDLLKISYDKPADTPQDTLPIEPDWENMRKVDITPPVSVLNVTYNNITKPVEFEIKSSGDNILNDDVINLFGIKLEQFDMDNLSLDELISYIKIQDSNRNNKNYKTECNCIRPQVESNGKSKLVASQPVEELIVEGQTPIQVVEEQTPIPIVQEQTSTPVVQEQTPIPVVEAFTNIPYSKFPF